MQKLTITFLNHKAVFLISDRIIKIIFNYLQKKEIITYIGVLFFIRCKYFSFDWLTD